MELIVRGVFTSEVWGIVNYESSIRNCRRQAELDVLRHETKNINRWN